MNSVIPVTQEIWVDLDPKKKKRKERKKGLTVFLKVHPEINKPSRTSEDLGEIPKVPGVQKARKALVVLGALETYAWKTKSSSVASPGESLVRSAALHSQLRRALDRRLLLPPKNRISRSPQADSCLPLEIDAVAWPAPYAALSPRDEREVAQLLA